MQETLRDIFGEHFTWGVATSALQTEGAHQNFGKGLSVWDRFARRPFRIRVGDMPDHGIGFFYRYREDIRLAKFLGFDAFRFSISWPRLLPDGKGRINPHGVLFYNKVIDECLKNGLEPWATVYHWDLPLAVEKRGGWPERSILDEFGNYVKLCATQYGDRVKNWIVLNEPMGFTSLGYLLGIHAPGRRSMNGFFRSVHHAALAQSSGGRILRDHVPGARIGTALSFALVEPADDAPKNKAAAGRLDAILNRLFLEPLLGQGYPTRDFRLFERLEKSMFPGDESALSFSFDFIGVQYYFRYIVRHNPFVPLIKASLVSASKRGVPLTSLKFESYPEGLYEVLKKLSRNPSMPEIFITESGASFKDELIAGRINDLERIAYHKATLESVRRAIDEGVRIKGFFAWTLADNFEWSFGYSARFGLIYVDRLNLNRIIKDSGHWYRHQLARG
jgi:beta-glucosidase